MGRHDAPGGDGSDRGTPSVPLNRRRTDAPGAAPALPEDPGDHPTTPGRSRADRRREGLLAAGIDPGRRPGGPGGRPAAAEGAATGPAGRPATPPGRPAAASGLPAAPAAGRPSAPARPAAAAPARGRPADTAPPSRPRPPAPEPVAPAAAGAATRGAGPAAPPPAAAGPRTTVAPFQAVPTPGPTEHPSAPLPDVSTPGWDRAWLDEPPAVPDAPPTAVPAVRQRPAEPPWAPAPGGAPAYRDWTRPSGSGEAPSTTAIPDRRPARGAAAAPATEVPDTGAYEERFGAPGPGDVDVAAADRRDRGIDERPPASGSQTAVVGGRAALRAERQAAEEQRRRDARRNGVPHVRTPVPGTEDDEPRPSRRRWVAALVAVAVVALGVLGVYSFTAPETREAADARPEPTPTTSAPVVTSGALPPLSVEPLPPVAEVPPTPVRVPVTVLNATGVTGLAGTIADVLAGEGWETVDTGAYEGDDVAVTTVYFTAGDETQRQSAQQLVEAHPEVTGPVERFFEVPEASAGGLVVVAAGDWQP